MDAARDWLKQNQEITLRDLNRQLFMESWDKYAKGTISSWEMEALCFYYHEHELINVDTHKYGISNFFALPEEPEVDYYFKRNGQNIPIYKTHKIIGTVINKNDNKSTITLLTTTGVVTVKFTKEYYAMFKKQISEKQEDGTKKIVEKGWFKRGNMLMLTGFRRGDQFVTKTYKHTPTHQLYKIDLTNDGRDLVLTHERTDAENGN
jgi:DNA polymerase-3 subunit alpha